MIPHGGANGPFQRFSDELDEFIDRWRDKPSDDRLSAAEIVGALQFRAFMIMQEVQGYERED